MEKEKEKEKYELTLSYLKGEGEDLQKKLKKIAEQNNGQIKSEKEENEKIILSFSFNELEDRDFFQEIGGLLIAEHYSLFFDTQTPEDQVDTRMFPEGIYHHFSFSDEYTAWRLANMLTAAFSTYTQEDFYDVSVVKVDSSKDENEYLVVFGFPFESVILMPEEIENFMDSFAENDDDLFTLSSVEKTKSKEELN